MPRTPSASSRSSTKKRTWGSRAWSPEQVSGRSSTLGRVIENKPSHEPAHEIVRTWGLEERFAPRVAHEHDVPVHAELLFVGDSLDDCLAGRRAGWRAGLIVHGDEREASDPVHLAADTRIVDLAAVAAALRSGAPCTGRRRGDPGSV